MRQRILCGVDESPEALVAARLAGALARCLDAPLVLAHVVPAVQANDGAFVLEPMAQSDLHAAHERAREHGAALLERLARTHGVADGTQTLLLVGDAGRALLEEAATSSTAALVVGARGHGPIGRAVLGSVSGHLAANATCPVVVVPHGMAGGPQEGPILCGVDGSEHAAQGAIVAAAAAQLLGRELVLVHILQTGLVLDEVAEREGWGFLSAAAEALHTPARLIAEPQAGAVAATLASVAARERAACLVVGSRGRGPMRSALLGSVSAGAVVSAPCPVIVVPPNAQHEEPDVARARPSAVVEG